MKIISVISVQTAINKLCNSLADPASRLDKALDKLNYYDPFQVAMTDEIFNSPIEEDWTEEERTFAAIGEDAIVSELPPKLIAHYQKLIKLHNEFYKKADKAQDYLIAFLSCFPKLSVDLIEERAWELLEIFTALSQDVPCGVEAGMNDDAYTFLDQVSPLKDLSRDAAGALKKYIDETEAQETQGSD